MSHPIISVIIPTFNRPSRLRNCLESLSKQDCPSDHFEVIVVNDGGEDVAPVTVRFIGILNIRQTFQSNAGPAAARNLGATMASGSYLALLDDDCTPMTDWISSIVKHARPGLLIGGKVFNLLSDNLCSEACQTLIDFLYLHLQGSSDLFFTSNNMVLSVADFQRIGGFNTSFRTSAGEDRELCIRAERMGIELIQHRDIRIGHSHDMDLGGFIRLHTKYGRATHTYHRAIRMLPPSKVKAPSGFFRGLLAYPFRNRLKSPVRQAMLLALSQVCTFRGYMSERYGNRR
jgi:glycosyltransferase involved in cell wall biosynthesis